MNFIPLEDLEDGRVYRLKSRNLLVGLWRAKTNGFIGVRQKFDSRYLFEEFHYDTDSHCGTARATEALDLTWPVPDAYWKVDLGLFEALDLYDQQFNEELHAKQLIEYQEAESRRWAPKTEATVLKEARIEKVRAWYRENPLLRKEYIERLGKAIKGEE